MLGLALVGGAVVVFASDDAVRAATVTAAGATREDPVPLGSRVDGTDWRVVVHSVAPVEADSRGQGAAPGKVLLQVRLTAVALGVEVPGLAPWASLAFVSFDGGTVGVGDGSSVFVPVDVFRARDRVSMGASLTGDTILEVPADWQDGVLAVSPGGDPAFVAVS